MVGTDLRGSERVREEVASICSGCMNVFAGERACKQSNSLTTEVIDTCSSYSLHCY
jgi:hypothetical protein